MGEHARDQVARYVTEELMGGVKREAMTIFNRDVGTLASRIEVLDARLDAIRGPRPTPAGGTPDAARS